MTNWWAQKLAHEGQERPVETIQWRHEPKRPPPPAIPSLPPKDELCPSCSSTNYGAAPGSNYRRCFDCGFPIYQSGTGVGSTKTDAPTKAATQVQGGGFNPQQIIGRA